MNKIYLLKNGDTNQFKIGFTSDWEKRRRHYITANPSVEFVAYVNTQEKSGRWVETLCHEEIKKIGGRFVYVHGSKTEWFEFDGEFCFEMLPCCKNRKVHLLY